MKKITTCTTILVGKQATIDGSTMIVRNEDSAGGLNPQKFVAVLPKDQPQHFQSEVTAVNFDLPKDPLRYTATPDAVNGEGVYAGGGINAENVTMTATETITTNDRIQSLDPFVAEGLGEADFVTVVLPYIHSAREGVTRMGQLLHEYGTYEPNGMAFSDRDEVWYLETIGGHHFAAVKIPDDAYVIAPNRFNITDFDFESPDTLYSDGLKELIDQHHLNPDFSGYNLRHIFGSHTIDDTRYNNPRAWYGQKYFNPAIEQDPMDQDLPFICHADRKITVEDIKFVLSSHYQNTDYDVYGTGSETDRKKFRPIGINRNLETHILQIRNDVSDNIAGIHWLAFGPNTFNALVPFYANVNDTPAAYRDTTGDQNPNQVYWLDNTLALLGDANFDLYQEAEAKFEQQVMAKTQAIQLKTDQTNATDLAKANDQMAECYVAQANQLLGRMLAIGVPKMKLSFSLSD